MVIEKNAEIFRSYLQTLGSNYVDKINTTILMHKGIDAMNHSLDPYTVFRNEEEIKAHNNAWKGYLFSGIGVGIAERDSLATIISLYEGDPAHLAGVRIGDRVITVDGINVRGLPFSDVIKKIKGEEETNVTITFDRPGVGKVNIPIVRKAIIARSVNYYDMINDSVGYIDISQFLINSYDSLVYAFNTLKKNNKFKYLVLDMRGNAGGLVQDAVNTVNMFLPKGKLVCDLKSENDKGGNYNYTTLYEPIDTNIKIVALTSNFTVSAGEIMLGALQDYDRAVLIGQRTYGKGYVQGTRPLAHNTELYVTAARYFTPSGRCIQEIDYTHKYLDGKVNKINDSINPVFFTKHHRKVVASDGIEPDVYLPTPSQLPEVVSLLISNNVLGDYATIYRNAHTNYPDMATFYLSKKDFTEFMKIANKKMLNINTQIESEMRKLDSLFKKDSFQPLFKKKINKIKRELTRGKLSELQKNEDLIKSLLEKEILIRYYNYKANIHYIFYYSPEIKEAIEIFKNKYDSILK
jgi:carboxyl-terminal processing protease